MSITTLMLTKECNNNILLGLPLQLYYACTAKIKQYYRVFHLNMSLYDNLYLNNCWRYENQTFFAEN